LVGLEEQRKKKHTAEEEEEGGGGYWEGAVACVLFAHTVVDADRVSAGSRETFPIRCAPDIWNEPARTMNTNFVFHCLNCFPTKGFEAFNSIHVCQLSPLLFTVNQLHSVRIIGITTARVIDAITGVA